MRAILVELDTWQRTHLDFISQSKCQDFDRLHSTLSKHQSMSGDILMCPNFTAQVIATASTRHSSEFHYLERGHDTIETHMCPNSCC